MSVGDYYKCIGGEPDRHTQPNEAIKLKLIENGDELWLVWYARDVLRGRWYEIEDLLDSFCVHLYICDWYNIIIRDLANPDRVLTKIDMEMIFRLAREAHD